MRAHLVLIVAALGAAGASVSAQAKPAGTIDCAVQALSNKQRTAIGVSLVDDQNGSFAARANEMITRPAAVCARANKWTTAQTDAAIAWSIWDLMDAELERRSGLGAQDLLLMHAFVEEDPSRVEKLASFTPAQISQLIATLRQRGVRLHDAGNDTVRELGFLLVRKEMTVEAGKFVAS